MNPAMNPAATDHVPVFMTGPGGSDVLLQVVGWVLVVSVLAVGLLFLRLHTLPERIAHRGHKLQFEIVAVLGLLALFTHIHLFWVAGLLLALIDFPDFRGMFGRIAQALESIAYNTGRSRLIRRETTTPPAIAAADQRQGSEELTDA
jgi:multisubunit Na+/H+ antiporter MnhF subunit